MFFFLKKIFNKQRLLLLKHVQFKMLFDKNTYLFKYLCVKYKIIDELKCYSLVHNMAHQLNVIEIITSFQNKLGNLGTHN